MLVAFLSCILTRHSDKFRALSQLLLAYHELARIASSSSQGEQCILLSAHSRWQFATWHSFKTPALYVDAAAIQQAITHCKEHPGVPTTWVRHVHRAFKQVALCCFGVPFNRWLTTSDDRAASARDRHWVGQILAMVHWPSVSGVTCWSLSSSNKKDTLNTYCERNSKDWCALSQFCVLEFNSLASLLF